MKKIYNKKNHVNLMKITVQMLVVLGLSISSIWAQTPVTIDLTTLGETLVDNSSNPNESQWYYSEGYLTLNSANGDYTLMGTNTNLCVLVSADMNVTLNNVNIRCVSTDLNTCLITLIGSNTLNNLRSDRNCTITSNTNGSLTGIMPDHRSFEIYGIFSITGDATVSVISYHATESGMLVSTWGSTIINIGADASLNVTGISTGLQVFSDHAFTLNCDGSAVIKAGNIGMTGGSAPVTITGKGTVSIDGEGYGFYTNNGSLAVEDCNVTVSGKEGYPAIYTNNNIKMNDAAKLTLKSGIGETHTFEKLDAASTLNWYLTNATTPDPLTNAVINVTVAAGQTGTVERKDYLPAYTITATAGTNGSISPSGTIKVTYGENATFIFTANIDYEIEEVLIDGTNNPAAVAAGSYTFEYVTANHTIAVNFKSTTGVEELRMEDGEWRIYPNPTYRELKIENGELKIENIEIYDIYGRKLLSHTANRSPHTVLDVSHLPAGMYFIKVGNQMAKFVKQ